MIIQGINLSSLKVSELIELVNHSIDYCEKRYITYFNTNSFNIVFNNNSINKIYEQFHIIHPDGIGVFLASKFLYGKKGFAKRITGSDFYLELINYSLKINWSFFFFGDTNDTLSKISITNPYLKINGMCNGFNFDNYELIDNINNCKPDILIVGLGSPKQEEWIVTNKDNINAQVIIAVGDGIKVFAGIKKRGPKFIQNLGLEWVIRLCFEPKRLWKRYIIGIPLFILRVLKYKLFKQ